MATITEPSTMITDYVLGLFTLVLSVMLLRRINFEDQSSAFWLAIAMLGTVIGAFAGGTFHGFTEFMSQRTYDILVNITSVSIGIGSLFFIVSATLSSVRNQTIQYLLLGFAIVEFIVFVYVIIFVESQFLYVIFDYGIAMLIVIILKLYSRQQFGDPSSYLLIAGIAISIIAASIQASGLSINDDYFNHNDLFHIIQLPAMYLFYRAGLVMRDVL